jgi:hypothetical protein
LNHTVVQEINDMGFKSRAIGIIAGTALALSIASGAMAENDVKMKLIDNSTGVCAATLSGEFNLGQWTWNGYVYEHTDKGDNSLDANVTQTKSQADATCYVTVSQVDPLTLEGGTISIPMDFTVAGGSAVSTRSDGLTYVAVTVNTSDRNNKPAGDYKGKVSVTASTSSN